MSDLLINKMCRSKFEEVKAKNSHVNRNKYNDLKTHKNKIYTGMKIGDSHDWRYNNGVWLETKKAPDRWTFSFNSIKTRSHEAPINSGANLNTKYHWYIIADQIATKLDNNSYMTSMKGVKFKIGHKRPHWKTFSYNYPEQQSYKEKVIDLLEHILIKLKERVKKYNQITEPV